MEYIVLNFYHAESIYIYYTQPELKTRNCRSGLRKGALEGAARGQGGGVREQGEGSRERGGALREQGEVLWGSAGV